jgi:tRNA nucleotidyltransferase (CCA-adding enzyme)
MADKPTIDPAELPARLRALPGVDRLQTAVAGVPAYLVGGAVRDLLLERPHPDLDVVIEGDVGPVANALGGELTEHERFQTAKVRLGELTVDLARSRAETYPQPGALPEVTPAALEEDLSRRDFTVNAMALPLSGEAELIDPHDGVDDLAAGRLRVLHEGSFRDDPTRALRAARYAARFGFGLEPETEKLLRATDLSAVSDDRVRAEMERIAAEPTAPRAYELLLDWGLDVQVDAGAPERASKVIELGTRPPWLGFADLAPAVAMAGAAPDEDLERLVAATPERPSVGVHLAILHRPERLLVARAMGAEWLDEHAAEWHEVKLEIDGEDLMAEGVAEGPGIGKGLAAALSAKLDGEVSGRDEELRVALEVARGEIPED